MDVWPALPLLIRGNMTSSSGMDNIIIALGQSNRVCQVDFWGLMDRQLEKVVAAMQVPFPELTHLRLISNGETLPVAPDSFLGGSAPRLALLSVLSSLEELFLRFQSAQSRPDWVNRRPPPSKRSVIPALNRFRFKGVIEYFEDLVTFIDAPQLYGLFITFFNQIDFEGPRLAQFISRTPIFGDCDAHVQFDDTTAGIRLPSHSKDFVIRIPCIEPGRQLSSVAQICNTCLPPLSMIEDLYVEHEYTQLVWKNDAIENTLWLQLLLPFPTIKNLYLSEAFVPGIAGALQEIIGTEVLPSLQNIFVEGLKPSEPFQENVGQFVAVRELSGHSITISVWDRCRA